MIALCLGGARNVWADLEGACALLGSTPRLIVACNFVGVHYLGRLDAWVTLHPERIEGWLADRAKAGGNLDYRVFTDKPPFGLGHEIEALKSRWFGSSGLYAAQVAIDRLGCAGAILCGVPMEEKQGHIHWRGDWDAAFHYHQGLREIRASNPPIRSMSGLTMSLFGAPDADWLKGLTGRDGDEERAA